MFLLGLVLTFLQSTDDYGRVETPEPETWTLAPQLNLSMVSISLPVTQGWWQYRHRDCHKNVVI